MPELVAISSKVHAIAIASVHQKGSNTVLLLENGTTLFPDWRKLDRISPKAGDYVVTREDGSITLMHKQVVDWLYRPI